MPSPKHKCAIPDCDIMISPRATHCRKHVPRTKEWIERQAKSQSGRTLSKETRQKISKAHSGRIETTCLYCGKIFLVKPYRLRKGQGKYCSNKCNYASRSGKNSPFWNGGKTTYTCDLCGKYFERQSCFVTGKNVFCSYRCSSIHKKLNQKTNQTNIEQLMNKGLQSLQIKFREQVPLCNIAIADFYIPKYKLAIFCDGNYWHNYPHGKPRDKRQTRIIEAHGIKVIRFWGSDIEKNIAWCIEIIHNVIQSPELQLEQRQLHLPTFE